MSRRLLGLSELPEKFVVFDLKRKIARGDQEVIQIVALWIGKKHFNEMAIFQETINRRSSEFEAIISDFREWCSGDEIYCFDKSSLDALIEICELQGLEFPFEPEKFHSLNEIFAKYNCVVEQTDDVLKNARNLLSALKTLSEKIKQTVKYN